MSDNCEDQRRFQRIAMDSPVHIRGQFNNYEASLVDISLNGLLVEGGGLDLKIGDTATALIYLTESDDYIIGMNVEVAHVNEYTGFRCTGIDLDSAARLRRLVELNVGNEAILERELAHLIESRNCD